MSSFLFLSRLALLRGDYLNFEFEYVTAAFPSQKGAPEWPIYITEWCIYITEWRINIIDWRFYLAILLGFYWVTLLGDPTG